MSTESWSDVALGIQLTRSALRRIRMSASARADEVRLAEDVDGMLSDAMAAVARCVR